MNTPCPDCKETTRTYTVKLIFTNRLNDRFYPKYIPQIKELCANCERYIRFAPQTPELMDSINAMLEKTKI